jgi:chromosome segregation ATPase
MSSIHSPRSAASAPRNGHAPAGAKSSGRGSVLDLLSPDDPLRREMEQLMAENKQLVSEMKTPPAAGRPEAPARHERPAPRHEAAGDHGGDAAQLREENDRLRVRIEELEHMLDATGDQTEQVWSEQQKEYEAILEEKSEVIRKLHQYIAKLKERAAETTPAGPEWGENPNDLRKELMQMKKEVEEARRQLEEDEAAMMEQARQMEMSLAKERVELARQRNEVQQMHRQLQHEIEQASRDGVLRERLAGLQRRNQEVAAGVPPAGADAPRRALPTQASLGGGQPRPQENSGFLKKLFGN